MAVALPQRVANAQADRGAHRVTLRRILLENGLSIVLVLLFLISAGFQIATGLLVYNQEQSEHGQAAIGLLEYLTTGHFIEALAENWESEFLQMGMFVWLSAFLYQRGSPESNDPYEKEEDPPVTAKSPWPVRRGGWVRKLYENSLTLTFLALFLISFFLHALGGMWQYNEEQAQHAQPTVSMLGYMGTSQFWFESMQNWQSEFLSLAAMVVLGVFLRQKGSAESKPVTVPHSRNE